MEDSAKFINDSFVDFAGKTHYFTVVATSTNKKGTYIVNEESGYCFPPVETEIHLGVSICNPEDPFDGYKGITKATKRADNSPAILYITKKCYGTNGLINALLKREAEYSKKNPGKYIKGYDEARIRYFKRKRMEDIENNFSDLEKSVIKEIESNPKFLDKIQEYIQWKEKQ